MYQQPGYPGGFGYPLANPASAPTTKRTTNGFAVAALVLGLVGFFGIPAILAVVFGCMALKEIRRSGERGRGMAIAGLSIGTTWLSMFLIALVTNAIVFGWI